MDQPRPLPVEETSAFTLAYILDMTEQLAAMSAEIGEPALALQLRCAVDCRRVSGEAR